MFHDCWPEAVEQYLPAGLSQTDICCEFDPTRPRKVWPATDRTYMLELNLWPDPMQTKSFHYVRQQVVSLNWRVARHQLHDWHDWLNSVKRLLRTFCLGVEIVTICLNCESGIINIDCPWLRIYKFSYLLAYLLSYLWVCIGSIITDFCIGLVPLRFWTCCGVSLCCVSFYFFLLILMYLFVQFP